MVSWADVGRCRGSGRLRLGTKAVEVSTAEKLYSLLSAQEGF